MPIYEYKCRKCPETSEVLRPLPLDIQEQIELADSMENPCHAGGDHDLHRVWGLGGFTIH